MAKYDEQVDRMLFLMEDKDRSAKKVNSSIAYHANGADGKVYGIIKEGTKYYIKTTESGKENLAESYDYINGFVNRRENEYKSYNEATKQLELKLMGLNEAYGKHMATSTVDFNRSEKTFANLTEAARTEIDRINQIFENSCKIGMNCICDPESKGKSTAENTTKNNDPFSEKAKDEHDFKGSNGTVKSATDNKDVSSNVDEDLQSDKMKTANSGSEKDYKDAHDDLDGESVADKKPSGGKVVKVNEGLSEFDYPDANPNAFDDGGMASMNEPEYDPADAERDGYQPMDDINLEDFNGGEIEDDSALYDNPEVGDDIAGAEDEMSDNEFGAEGDELDSLLEEFEKAYGQADTHNATKSAITGPEKVMDKESNPINGTNNGIDGETDEKWKRVDEEDGNVNEPTKQGNEETMKSYQKAGNLPVQSWDKMDKKDLNEAISAIVEDVYKKITAPKKETLEEAIYRIVKEEVTKLDAWGKHPRYQKEPMTTPANKEVLAGTAEKDWNDDSAKGEQPYGKKIGKGDPFDKVVNMLTDQVMSQLKESMKK